MRSDKFLFYLYGDHFFDLIITSSLFSQYETINIGALGDSISTGFNSGGWGDREKKDSWTTGYSSQVDSHYKKIRKILGDKIKVLILL